MPSPIRRCCAVTFSMLGGAALALNGDTTKLTLIGLEGWKTFEIITQGDTSNLAAEDGSFYKMPGEMDGMGVALIDGEATLRVWVNHETPGVCDTVSDATVTEVDLDRTRFRNAIANKINNLAGPEQDFVKRFRRAYDAIVIENGTTVTSLSRPLARFCSSQAYGPNTFGIAGEGYQNQIYITGEERPDGRSFAIDSSTRTMYQLSGRTGDASGSQGGIGGMPFDSFENVALVRTFEKNHVALLLSVDSGNKMLKFYVGQKNKGFHGQNDSTDFLARNGLAYGSWFYLRASLPTNPGETVNGFFHPNSTDALKAEKFEDIDTNPQNPTQVVLGEEKTGVYVLDFALCFLGGVFQWSESDSTYTLHMIVKDSDSPINEADNVAWTAANLIYVATDGKNGAIWEMDSNGNDQIQIAASINNATHYNPSGVIDISSFVGYEPSSILLSNTMSCGSSMSVIINPDAQLVTTKNTSSAPSIAPVFRPAHFGKTSFFASSSCSCISTWFCFVFMFVHCLSRNAWM